MVTLLVVGPEGPFGSVFLHVALVVRVVVAATELSGMHDVTKFIKRNYEAKYTNLYASFGYELHMLLQLSCSKIRIYGTLHGVMSKKERISFFIGRRAVSIKGECFMACM